MSVVPHPELVRFVGPLGTTGCLDPSFDQESLLLVRPRVADSAVKYLSLVSNIDYWYASVKLWYSFW